MEIKENLSHGINVKVGPVSALMVCFEIFLLGLELDCVFYMGLGSQSQSEISFT